MTYIQVNTEELLKGVDASVLVEEDTAVVVLQIRRTPVRLNILR